VGVSRLREPEVCMRKTTSCEKSAELDAAQPDTFIDLPDFVNVFNLKNQSWREQFASLVSLASRYFENCQISSMGTSGFCVGESRVPFGNCEGVQQLRFCNF
jgi:hypothetical protein